MLFGLIGESLSHSFSKKFFEQKFASLGLSKHQYHNIELAGIDEFPSLKAKEKYRGLNVTVPYKELIMPYLDGLDQTAKEIGAVNCINIKDNKLIGYNTDAYGFSQSIKPFLDTNHQRALILGKGGASKAVAFVLKKIGVEIFFVTSHEKKKDHQTLLYHEVNPQVMSSFKMVVNTTPLGTFPSVDDCPQIPYEYFTPEHLACDLIYNPTETRFLQLAKRKGAITMNGESMLRFQAEKSWEIWNS